MNSIICTCRLDFQNVIWKKKFKIPFDLDETRLWNFRIISASVNVLSYFLCETSFLEVDLGYVNEIYFSLNSRYIFKTLGFCSNLSNVSVFI